MSIPVEIIWIYAISVILAYALSMWSHAIECKVNKLHVVPVDYLFFFCISLFGPASLGASIVLIAIALIHKMRNGKGVEA